MTSAEQFQRESDRIDRLGDLAKAYAVACGELSALLSDVLIDGRKPGHREAARRIRADLEARLKELEEVAP